MLSAAAEEGKSLLELDQVFDSVTAADNLGTIGFSTSGCSLPVGTPGKMAFILGVLPRISDTRIPIWMKLWGCIEFTLKLCIVIFSTSGLDLKTGNWGTLL